MYLSDYHTHCSLSFDSKTPVEDMVRAGIAQGLQEMCLTDHVDLFRPRETARWEHDFSNREETFARADQAADGKIIVRRGIELGEAMRDFAYADELLSRLPELDFVIGSQHQLSEKYDWNDLYFMPEATEQEAREQIADYLTLALETAKWGKFSVLGHLTLPLRYMNENHGMHMSFDGFEDEVARLRHRVQRQPRQHAAAGRQMAEALSRARRRDHHHRHRRAYAGIRRHARPRDAGAFKELRTQLCVHV